MFGFLKGKKEPQDIKEVLESFRNLEKKFDKVLDELENLKNKNKFSIQKMGIIRYNPFSGVGSDQSFSIALLDENNDGVVVTSLYTREGNRVYGKAVKNSASEYTLSEEEKKAIEKAASGNDKLQSSNVKSNPK